MSDENRGRVPAENPKPAVPAMPADVRLENALSKRGYAVLGVLLLLSVTLVPILNGPASDSALYLPDYLVTLFGKFSASRIGGASRWTCSGDTRAS